MCVSLLHSTYQSTGTCHSCTNAFALAHGCHKTELRKCHGSGASLSDATGGNARKCPAQDRGSSSKSSSRIVNRHGHDSGSSSISESS